MPTEEEEPDIGRTMVRRSKDLDRKIPRGLARTVVLVSQSHHPHTYILRSMNTSRMGVCMSLRVTPRVGVPF